jgi:ankyrin repeat protein
MHLGCQTDLLMAAALGHVELAAQLLETNPESIRMCVSPRWFPMQDRRAGGTIYIWTLGAGKGAHEIAREFGHDDVFRALMARTPASLQLAVACEIEDRHLVRELRDRGTAVEAADHARLVAAASRDRTAAALLMLEAGWPAAAADEGVTALHWAAFHANITLVSALLQRGAPTDVRDREYQGTPRQWAEHGPEHGGRGDAAGYARVLELLS